MPLLLHYSSVSNCCLLLSSSLHSSSRLRNTQVLYTTFSAIISLFGDDRDDFRLLKQTRLDVL